MLRKYTFTFRGMNEDGTTYVIETFKRFYFSYDRADRAGRKHAKEIGARCWGIEYGFD